MNTSSLNSFDTPAAGLAYYGGADIIDVLQDAIEAAGLDPNALDIDALAPLDEFHALGRAATLALAELAGVREGLRVLDVGAGIGGPARFLAARYGAQVTALDATPRFCAAAEFLTRGAGLADRVGVVCGDALALPFADASFDLVWTQALGQNIAEKPAWVSEMARVLRPGGRLACFEIIAGPGGPLQFPVPWADHQEQSWLVSATELKALLGNEPLRLVSWNQGQDALASVGVAAQQLPAPADSPLGLHLLMPDHDARMAGLSRDVVERRSELVQAVAERHS